MSELASENVRRTGPTSYLIWLLIVTAVIGAGYAFYYYSYWRQSPRYALWQMVRAIQAGDTQTLFNYIDLQAIADNLVEKSVGDVDSLLEKKGFGPSPEENEVSRLVRSFTKKFARFLAPKLLSSLEPQIKVGLEKYLAELNTMERAALSAIPTQAQIRQDNGLAEVTLVDPVSGRTFTFKMAKLPPADHWRIVEVKYEDFRDFIGKKFLE